MDVRPRRLLSYGVAVVSVGVALAVRLALDPVLRNRQPFPTFSMAVAVTATVGGLYPALVALVLGYATADWFFLPPRGSLSMIQPAREDSLAPILFLLVGTIIALLSESMHRARQRADQQAAAARASEAGLAASREQLRALAGHLEAVREEERSRIARELHDDLGQTLTGIRLGLSWLTGRLARATDEPGRVLVERTRSMIALVDGAVETVRRTATALRPSLLDDLGLVAAIEWQAAEFLKRTSIRSEVVVALRSPTVDRQVSTAVFRIVQEALTNVARHARAGRVRITLQEDDDLMLVRVTDDGRGITEAEQTAAGSLGLLGMRERARLLGGDVTISGTPGRGTTVTARVPLRPPGATAPDPLDLAPRTEQPAGEPRGATGRSG